MEDKKHKKVDVIDLENLGEWDPETVGHDVVIYENGKTNRPDTDTE